MKFEYYKEGSEYRYEFSIVSAWDELHVDIKTIVYGRIDSWVRTCRQIDNGIVIWHDTDDGDGILHYTKDVRDHIDSVIGRMTNMKAFW